MYFMYKNWFLLYEMNTHRGKENHLKIIYRQSVKHFCYVMIKLYNVDKAVQ